MALSEYLQALNDGLAQPGEFVAKPYYSPEADTLYFYGEDVPSHAERLNPILTLFLANDDSRMVGIKIKGVQWILRCMKRLALKEVIVDEDGVKDGGGIKLGVMTDLALVPQPEDPELLKHFEPGFEKYRDVVIPRIELQAN